MAGKAKQKFDAASFEVVVDEKVVFVVTVEMDTAIFNTPAYDMAKGIADSVREALIEHRILSIEQ